MKLIVTGALGHIGSRIIRELPVLFPGVEIVMIDNMATQRYHSLFDLTSHGLYTFIEGDNYVYKWIRLQYGKRKFACRSKFIFKEKRFK